MSFNFLKSKTFWGSVLTAASWVYKQPQIDPATVLTAVGSLIGVVGVRDAIAKNGNQE